jgi:hypothetical protein
MTNENDMPRIYLVISDAQDETSLCSRAFWSHDKAKKYQQECVQNFGGRFRVFSVRIDCDRSEVPVGVYA